MTLARHWTDLRDPRPVSPPDPRAAYIDGEYVEWNGMEFCIEDDGGFVGYAGLVATYSVRDVLGESMLHKVARHAMLRRTMADALRAERRGVPPEDAADALGVAMAAYYRSEIVEAARGD